MPRLPPRRACTYRGQGKRGRTVVAACVELRLHDAAAQELRRIAALGAQPRDLVAACRARVGVKLRTGLLPRSGECGRVALERCIAHSTWWTSQRLWV